MEKDEREDYVAIWSKVVDTRMHFNDMCVKTSQFGLAFVAGALGVAIALIREKQYAVPMKIGDHSLELHVTVFILLAGALVMR